MTTTVPPLVPTQGTAREGDSGIEDDDGSDDNDDEFEDEEYVIGEDSEFDDRLVDVLRLLVHVV